MRLVDGGSVAAGIVPLLGAQIQMVSTDAEII
jgi:hypothetical protein